MLQEKFAQKCPLSKVDRFLLALESFYFLAPFEIGYSEGQISAHPEEFSDDMRFCNLEFNLLLWLCYLWIMMEIFGEKEGVGLSSVSTRWHSLRSTIIFKKHCKYHSYLCVYYFIVLTDHFRRMQWQMNNKKML